MIRKGIILAGGLGTRLYPLTEVTSKHLLHVYDKPLIYYPLSLLMSIGIQDILLITTNKDLGRYQQLLKDGSQWGVAIHYADHEMRLGLPQCFLIGSEFIQNQPCVLALGDNLFYGQLLNNTLKKLAEINIGAAVCAYRVPDPQKFGVIEFDEQNNIISLEEKPTHPRSNFIIPGLYFYDQQVVEIVRQLMFTTEKTITITDVNRFYLQQNQLFAHQLDSEVIWFDCGTHETLWQANHVVGLLEQNQGIKIACPEELAFRSGYISYQDFDKLIKFLPENSYQQYLQRLIKNEI